MARTFLAELGLFAFLMCACSGSADKGASGGTGTGGTGTGGSTGGTGAGAEGGAEGGAAGNAGASGTGAGDGYCSDRTPSLVEGSGTPASPATPLEETPAEGSACDAIERQFAPEFPEHVADCTEIAYSTNPPCTGQHYGIWPQFRAYDEPVPRGFWVHGLEHGAVVLLYSCSDCEDEVSAATELLAEIGDDPLCVAGGRPSRRTLLIPDPRLDSRWAAASWGFTLNADCFEPEVFRAFVEAHRGQGPEAVCSDGLDVTEGG